VVVVVGTIVVVVVVGGMVVVGATGVVVSGIVEDLVVSGGAALGVVSPNGEESCVELGSVPEKSSLLQLATANIATMSAHIPLATGPDRSLINQPLDAPSNTCRVAVVETSQRRSIGSRLRLRYPGYAEGMESQPSPDPFAPPPPDEPDTPATPGGPMAPPNVPIVTDVPEQLPDVDFPTIIPPDR